MCCIHPHDDDDNDGYAQCPPVQDYGFVLCFPYDLS